MSGCAIAEWCVYESTGFHLGNIGLTKGDLIMSSPLAGAWERVSDDLVEILIFTDTHVASTGMRKNRKSVHGRALTEAEEAEGYRTAVANAGTYTLSGSTLTMHRIASLRLDVMDQDRVEEFTLEGDTLIFKNINGTGRPTGRESTWRRVSS